ncbi:MAG: aldose 1-epimerase, partial [Alphaproteobacteria bacterium]|nr:aldose 1-epimerase [Alphaproteobacteria bacterium]
YDANLALDPLNFSSFPLTPFSNRIGFGKLDFNGKIYNVGPAFGGEPHPNHGSGWQSEWTLDEKGDDFAKLSIRVPKSADSPYDYEAHQIFQLTETGLSITMEIKNTGEEALPFGTGHHPYFVRTPKTSIQANLPKVWFSKDMVPTELVDVPDMWNFKNGKVLDPQNLEAKHGGDGSAYIDHCFTEWDRVARITWPEFENTTLRITADESFGHFVLFVPSKGDFFCAEPVTNATDGFNLKAKGTKGTGTIVLAPKETFKGVMNFDLE